MTDKQIRDRIVGALSVSMMPMFTPVKCPPGCAYAMNFHAGVGGKPVQHCDYILKEGNGSRGCDPGPGCTRYEKKPKKAGPKFTWDERAGFQMWLEGKTDREIAEALGVDREKIGQVRRRKWMKEANKDG